ncbi:MAG: 4Fe-4S dicluster domain-containing protein [Candidatus Saganbacteria bacterium]|nr:4Fe-4S dicluster domain-containing protein [Candidatus Saganbacteria bacterium]
MKKNMGWKELDFGDSVNAGTAAEFHTGDWRSDRPVFHKENCINCLFCWVNCPDSAIILDENNKVAGIDYRYCKGCGICDTECPTKKEKRALTMEPERK